VFCSKPTNTEKEITILETKILESKKKLVSSRRELSEISSKISIQENSVNEIQELVFKEIKYLINQTKDFSDINKIISTLSIDNISNVKEEINSIIIKKNENSESEQCLLFSEYKSHKLSDIKSKLNEYEMLRAQFATLSTEERLKSVNVVASTLDGYIGRYTDTKLNVEHIFLDEAGYANIIKALTLFNHTTPISFFGDHKQLPPVCEINDSKIENENKLHNMFLWAQSAIFLDSLFFNSKNVCRNQYLQNQDFNSQHIKRTSLNLTYRFGSNLAKILAKYVYTNDFESSNPKSETKILSFNATRKNELRSRISESEVSVISDIVADLKQKGNNDFVILTPYRKQIQLLNKALPDERNDLKILTVHGSQGREWDTVILSVVDTSDKWFVDTTNSISKGLNLVNTAVSRAKRNLIIVCDKNYWAKESGQLITELINSE